LYKIFQENNYQIVKFLFSGLIATTINFIFYSTVFFIIKNIIIASLCGYSLGLFSSFLLAKIWVFRNKSQKKVIKSFFIFCFIYLMGGLEMSLIIAFLNQLFENYRLAWLFGASIGALNNYLGVKYFLFKK
tara:strand:- start:17 stop:409 length:393 start_codon:yes stop_codon:yes gene_type:complete